MTDPRPKSAQLRAYNVGFGDCLLLSIDYAASARHVLIDFGTSKLPARAPATRMLDVAKAIEQETGGHLDLIVATHRHSDHISGFGAAKSGDVIESLQPAAVLQPWTEHPDLDPAARTPAAAESAQGRLALSRTLHYMSAFAGGAASEGRRLAAVARFPKSVASRLEFLGETNITNPAAVERLMAMGRAGRPLHASFGDDLGLDDLLPGVTIDVLGPPTLEDHPSIARQTTEDAEQFWHLAGSWGLAASERSATVHDLAPLFSTGHVLKRVPQAAKWLVPQIERAYAEEVLSLLRVLDGVLNNTSLILLMRIADTTLLFPGDAQIENWSYALFDAPNADQIRRRLAKTHVYKVGHHGSLNGTPKTMWNDLARRGDEQAPGRLITVLSTAAGKHGDARRNTEVPRRVLLEALRAGSDARTTQSTRSNKRPWIDVAVPLSGGR